jgi:hypothetical protein
MFSRGKAILAAAVTAAVLALPAFPVGHAHAAAQCGDVLASSVVQWHNSQAAVYRSTCTGEDRGGLADNNYSSSWGENFIADGGKSVGYTSGWQPTPAIHYTAYYNVFSGWGFHAGVDNDETYIYNFA